MATEISTSMTGAAAGRSARAPSCTPFRWTVRVESSLLPSLVVVRVMALDPRDAVTRGLTEEVPPGPALLGDLARVEPSVMRMIPANSATFVSVSCEESGADIRAWAVPSADDFGHRIEWRRWYRDGKYLGDKAAWEEDVEGRELAKLLTGDFYGDWPGCKSVDGAQVLVEFVRQEKEARMLGASNHAPDALDGVWYHEGERSGAPIKLSDWGELRIVTWPLPASPASEGAAGGAS